MYALGIDTSNYKTSVAVVDAAGEIICNLQKYLDVKKGERGLRQSVALFQHINNLPTLLEEALQSEDIRKNIRCVSVSAKPRPLPDSYMPVFNAGITAGKIIAASLGISYYAFSHQEGHIEAVKYFSPLRDLDQFVSFHFSGGTTEVLRVKRETIDIAGGSKDLSLGQVLDRVGVAMGYDFPAGQLLDDLAMSTAKPKENLLPEIKSQDGYINLSGIETKCQRILHTIPDGDLAVMLFERLSQGIVNMMNDLYQQDNINNFLFVGGVSSSLFLRRNVLAKKSPQMNICFGDPTLSSDNAVGTALLGGKKEWL